MGNLFTARVGNILTVPMGNVLTARVGKVLVIYKHGQINSGELWEAYLDDCREQNKPAIALRTFSEYMNKLIELDLVRWDRALVRGKVRVFSPVN
jgi:hypothetical protein